MMTFVALILGAVLHSATTRADYVSFCEIAEHPERYDGNSVLTSGIYTSGPEYSTFVDPACPPTDDRDFATHPVGVEGRGEAGWKRLAKIIKRQDQQAFVVVRAKFDAYRRYDRPLPEDPRVGDILKRGASRFGHLNFARFQLRIESIEFVAPVSK